MKVHQATMCGLPAIWVECEGPHTGAMMFRVGFADEPMTWRGASHLVEHLALHGTDPYDVEFNGATSLHTTSFFAKGSVERVAEFLASTAQQLHRLPAERLDAELRVLRAEAQRSGGSVAGDHLSARFGNKGVGLADAPELFHHWASMDEVNSWAGERFTGGNCALWFCGPRPRGLELSLPDGQYFPIGLAPHRMDWRGHQWLGMPGNLVAVSMLGPDNQAIRATAELLKRRATEKLREQAGSTYAVQAGIQVIGDNLAQLMLFADALEGEEEKVRETLMTELSILGLGGPKEDELNDINSYRVRHIHEELGPVALAQDAALRVLAGKEIVPVGNQVAECAIVTTSQVKSIIEEAWSTMVWTVAAMPKDQRLMHFRSAPTQAVEGKAFRFLEEGGQPSKGSSDSKIVIGATGMSVVSDGGDDVITVMWGAVEAVVVNPDGSRVIHNPDGSGIVVHRDKWEDGDHIISVIEREAPVGKLIRMAA